MAFTDSILVRLGLDNSAFNRGLEGANQGVKRMQMAFKAFAGLAVVGVFKRMVDNARELGDTLGTLSAATGVASSTIQTLRHATIVAGGSADEADKAISRLNRTIGDAIVKGGETRASFDALGVSLSDADGNARKTEDILNDVANALSQVENKGIRAGIASKLFGEQALAFTDAISKGADEIKRLKEELEKTGEILTDLQVRELDRFDKTVKKSTESASKSFARFVGNWLTNANVLAKSLSDVDFWKSITGDEESDARWKKRIDAFLFGSQMIEDVQQKAIKTAQKQREEQERLNEAKKNEANIDEQRFATMRKLDDAIMERDRAKRAPALFGSLQELANADISRGATPQLLAQRNQARYIQFLEANAERLKNAGLVDLSEKGFAQARFRRQNLTLAAQDVRNPLAKFDEQIDILQKQLQVQEDQLKAIRDGQEYTGNTEP